MTSQCMSETVANLPQISAVFIASQKVMVISDQSSTQGPKQDSIKWITSAFTQNMVAILKHYFKLKINIMIKLEHSNISKEALKTILDL